VRGKLERRDTVPGRGRDPLLGGEEEGARVLMRSWSVFAGDYGEGVCTPELDSFPWDGVTGLREEPVAGRTPLDATQG